MLRSALVTSLAALLVLSILADPADAQRRRRRRPPPVEETTQADPAAEGGEGARGSPAEGAQASPQPPDQRPGGAGPAAPQPSPPALPLEEEALAEDAGDPGEGTAPLDDSLDAEPLGPDLGPIRSEFTTLMDEIVQARSRVATLGRQLFDTRVRVVVQNRATDDNSLARLVLTLDGAPIFRADSAEFSGEDGRQVFDGFAAPGPHVLTVEVEQRARADDGYRYTLRDSYRFQVLRGKMTEVEVVLDDDSDIAEDFADDEEGEYDVRTRFRVATRNIAARR